MVVENRRGRKITGRLRLDLGAWECSGASEFDLVGIDRDSRFSTTISLKPPFVPSAAEAKLSLDTGLTTEEFKDSLIALGDGDREVTVEGKGGVFVVENGFLTVRIAPGFCASIFAIERDGVNYLLTSYPESGEFMWMNPWFGGVHPFLNWSGDTRLSKEKFVAEAIKRTGVRGIEWSGVKLSCELEHKDHRWLKFEVEYLTMGGSNIVAVVSRWTNSTTAPMRLSSGVAAWLRPGGSLEHVVLHYEQDKVHRYLRRGDYAAEFNSGRWAAVENPEEGDVVAVIAADQNAHISAEDTGRNGAHLFVNVRKSLGSEETKESLTWLVLTDSVERARIYRALQEVWQLP
ncbi:MAG: hypothetical protein DRP95_00955 [Candidatus Latescibacterota bacterium]|nr:MAG: hypothetical protein DRP95_00955 [Candidatus Latescibacterota bacterium]